MVTVPTGDMLAVPQALFIGVIVTVGGFFTVTVCVVFVVPQALVTDNFIV